MDPFHYHVLAMKKNQNIAGPKMDGFGPTLDRGVEGVPRGTDDLFPVYR